MFVIEKNFDRLFSSMKRPWPGGLSELIKGAHVKVKRMSLEKNDYSSSQSEFNSDSLASAKISMDVAKDGTTESVSIPDVSFSKNTDSSMMKKRSMSFSANKMEFKLNKTDSSTPLNEKVTTILTDTATLIDEKLSREESSESDVKALDCGGEVKKKRAEPVPLPLLALFLQQLKTKTRPTKPKQQSEACRFPSQSDQTCQDTAVAENLSSATALFTSSPNTQLNVQPASSPSSQAVTSSPLTCTISSTEHQTVLTSNYGSDAVTTSTSIVHHTLELSTPKKVSPPSSAFAHNVTLNTSLSDTTHDIKILSFTLADASSDCVPNYNSKIVQALTLEEPNNEHVHVNVTNGKSTTEPANDSFTVPCPELEAVPWSPPPEAVPRSPPPEAVPRSPPPEAVPRSPPPEAVPRSPPPEAVPRSPPPEAVPRSPPPEAVPRSPPPEAVPRSPPPEAVPRSPPPEAVPRSPPPEAVPRSPPPEAVPRSPSCAPSSPYTSAPSSPDPFPPNMFSYRPKPPRKSIDPFPPCLSLSKPRSLQELADSLLQGYFTHLTPTGDPKPPNCGVTTEANSPVVSLDPCIPKEIKPSLKTSKGTKVKQKKVGKSKLIEDSEVMDGPVPVLMQPNLEEVEGQLFVSFMSKKALEIHLGDEAKEEILLKSTENVEDDVPNETESIEALEKVLLHDLKNMKYRQVIHPVLQAVGLKLNLLDVTLSIDLQYLGVCLPIPPPIHLVHEGSSVTSSQVHFVSRTGKTTDITKIKGWREKFSTSSLSVPGATASSDTGQRNLSAFCSDMLDEYLESEGKLIDERAANFSQAVVTPVAYQLPTKSTSYVRTLDSVLKKQAFPLENSLSKPSVASKKSALKSKSKEAGLGIKKKSSSKTPFSSTEKKLGGNSSKKSSKPKTSKPVSTLPSAAPGLPKSKTSHKESHKKCYKTSLHSLQTLPSGRRGSSTQFSNLHVGRSSGLPKTLVKLRDVEDGAVWEGKNRTYITVERATIALSCLVTAEGIIGGNTSTVIKRRAPPCLNDFCRLGCVCASLVQERRQHHCGKPQCMLGCDCLRRKVVLLKNEDTHDRSGTVNHADENGTKFKRKKNRISYILSGSDTTPEPVLRVKTLWVPKNDLDSEQLYVPVHARPLQPQPVSIDRQKDFHPSTKQAAVRAVDEALDGLKKQESLDCARVRPFYGRKLSPPVQSHMKECHLNSHDSPQEMEEGELRSPTQTGPTKRLEIVSKCKWKTKGSRNIVLRTVCERMAQDRLERPFWIGKYQIQPKSKTVRERNDGSVITYKVVISQPHIEESEEKKEEEEEAEEEGIKQPEARLIDSIEKSEVKGLPLLSHVTPAGLLKAEKKPSGALGQIMVNGKLYPQAKLELGQMGALHPANRLAAYITGRICVANKPDPKAVTTATKTSHTAPVTRTSVATTTDTSTLYSTVTLTKPTVAKVPEVSQQQSTASTSTLPLQCTVKSLIPPSSMLTEYMAISVTPNIPVKANEVSQSLPASDTKDGPIQVLKTASASGSAESGKTFVLGTTGSNVAHAGSGMRMVRPPSSTLPAVPGQRMMMLKSARPTGRVVHLVPLSQLKPFGSNVVIQPQQSKLTHLPNPVPLTKPQMVTPAASSTTPSAEQDQNIASVHSTTIDTVMKSTTSLVRTAPASPVSGSKTLLVCNKPNSMKIVPRLVRDCATNALRMMAETVIEDSKKLIDSRRTFSESSAQKTSEGHLANQGLHITSQNCLTSKNDASQKLDNLFCTSLTPTKESCEDSQCSKMSQENVIFIDHNYSFEMKPSTPSIKPVDLSKASSDSAKSSTYHMLFKEVLDLGPVKEAEGCGTSAVVLGTESGDESKSGSQLLEEEVDSDCTEVTEDSDPYNDMDSSQSSDEDLSVFTDSEEEDKNMENQDSVDTDMQGLTEKDDDELVDIETFEEGVEKSPAPPEHMQQDNFQMQSSDGETEKNWVKVRKRKDEKKRRIQLKNCFNKLQHTLNIEDPKVPIIRLLSEAKKEIHSLMKKRDHLVEMRDKLRMKRAYYMEMAFLLSGKSKTSISQRLDEIITRQKLQESEDKANISLHLRKSVPMHSQRNTNTKGKMGTSCKAENLSITKQKHLGFQNRRTENVSPRQKIITAEPSQSTKPPDSRPTAQLKKCPPPSPVLHENTRHNILSLNKSQTMATDQGPYMPVPQVIPVRETVPCNQIINIDNYSQPLDLTLGERKSASPGVASLSISLPPSSHPPCEENRLHTLQPEDLRLASSPVNMTIHNMSPPKISSVSLETMEKLLVVPSVAPIRQPQAVCNSLAMETQHSPTLDATLLEMEKHFDKQLEEIVQEKSEHDTTIKTEEPKKQKDDKNTLKPEQDDDRLMSLLDELVFLNQATDPQGTAQSLTDASDVLTELLTSKEADMDKDDDERSLSPLFLKLDEDLLQSPTSKDEEIDDIPPKVDDLVKVIFGSDSPPNSSESEITASASDDCTHVSGCHVKHDAPTPPPLLQMKTGVCTVSDCLKEQTNLSWRPMPKLAPLGLKTQEAGHPKFISPNAPKSDSKTPSLHNTHVK